MLRQNLVFKTFTVISIEGVEAKYHCVQHTPHRPYVNLGRRTCLSCEQLWRHELQTACGTFLSRKASIGTKYAEIAQFNFYSTRIVNGQNVNVVSKEDVLELDVSVDDFLVVAVLECQHKLHYNLTRLLLWYPASLKALPVV